jgi:putative ABC transport system ATP-binding protein
MSGVLGATGLVLDYGRRPALRGVDLRVEPGEVLAVTGRSGSGKSSLLLCLAGVLVPDAGEVRWGDRVVSTLPEKERSALRRSEFGVLFQYGQLVSELTALDNVALPLLLGGAPRPSAEEVARSWLDRFGVAALAGARPREMSGGQAQLVAVARALVTEPAVLFADEPTGALDSLAGEDVMAALIETARDQGTSVVLVTHDARVAAYGDREVEVRDGVVLADDGLPTGDAVHAMGERS